MEAKRSSVVIFLILINLNFSFLYAQQIAVTYSLDNSERIEASQQEMLKPDIDPRKKQMIAVSIQAHIEARKYTYSLKIADTTSFFHLNNTMPNDAHQESINTMTKAYVNKGNFYQNSSTKQVIEQTTDKQTNIIYPFDFFDWQLTAETENILGYTCYKATTTYTEPHPAGGKDFVRHITVWFAPDIPLSFGPQGYGGLPGLILKKCQSGTCFIADKIEEKKVKIAPPKEETITREAYFNQFKKANPFGF